MRPCMQPPWLSYYTAPEAAHQSEDCLLLSIFTPGRSGREEHSAAARGGGGPGAGGVGGSSVGGVGTASSVPVLAPVLVFLHGGSWEYGSATPFDGGHLAQAHGLVVVTVNCECSDADLSYLWRLAVA